MAGLKARFVRFQGSPGYPTKLEVLAAPEILRRHVPPAWLGRREIAGALGAFLAAGAAGCRDNAIRGQIGTSKHHDESADRQAAIVAPLFEHGDGKGRSRYALACVAVAAPIYLPEEEALAVIRDELGKSGVATSPSSIKLNDVVIVGHKWKTVRERDSEKMNVELVEVSGPLEADLGDPERRVMIEYVSKDDFDPLGGDDRGSWDMDIKGVAVSVGCEVGKQGHGIYFGAFYDPVAYFTWSRPSISKYENWAASSEEAREKATQMLREQVQDFVAWLKGQGVI
jgi:hypothetical protein